MRFPLVICLLMPFLCSCGRKQYNHADTFIAQYIPEDAKLVVKHDDHGGFHGDGTLWQIYELSEQARKNFESKISGDANWESLPLPKGFAQLPEGLLHDDFPTELTEGSYFFYDFQPEWYPENKSLKKPVWDRPSFNFIIILYDSENGRIYVDNEDT